MKKGELWPRVVACTEAALESGALVSIDTEGVTVEDGGFPFWVRVAKGLARRGEAAGPPKDPFDPPEPALTVGEVPPAHLAVLNKYNVVAQHLLVVTRRFEPQDALLTPGDFQAWWACLAEVDALGFYNSSTVAGASQAHRHLQLVPLPLGGAAAAPAVEALLTSGGFPCVTRRFEADPGRAHADYLALLERVGRRADRAAYNLLVTRTTMAVVPRRKEAAQGVSLNALAFAGSLFVQDSAALARVRASGPLALLRECAGV